MSAIHIPSKNREEIQRIIDSAKERESTILYYDALRILRFAGASVVTTYLALNPQEIVIFSSQVEPPIVLKKVNYDRPLSSGVEIYKGISNSIEAVNLAVVSSESTGKDFFLIQETAPPDLKLSIVTDETGVKLTDIKDKISITIPFLSSVNDIIAEREMLKTFLFNATDSEDYDIKSLGLLLLINCSLIRLFSSIKGIEIKSMFLYREGLGYIVTDAFLFLR